MTLMLLENDANVEALSNVCIDFYPLLISYCQNISFNNLFVQSISQDGRTPLHYACSCGHRDITRILLDKGANLEATADVSI